LRKIIGYEVRNLAKWQNVGGNLGEKWVESIMIIKTMKKLFCLLVFLFLSCNKAPVSEKYCVEKVTYINQKLNLIPSVIQIEIKDTEKFIFKNIEKGKLTNVFLYSLKKEDRYYFRYIDEMKIKGKPKTNKETTILTLITGYFDSEIYHKWTKNEIEKILKTDIGLVIGKDTLRLKKCN
jgi:hypothetical protein